MIRTDVSLNFPSTNPQREDNLQNPDRWPEIY